jgi:hypothetical protein
MGGADRVVHGSNMTVACDVGAGVQAVVLHRDGRCAVPTDRRETHTTASVLRFTARAARCFPFTPFRRYCELQRARAYRGSPDAKESDFSPKINRKPHVWLHMGSFAPISFSMLTRHMLASSVWRGRGSGGVSRIKSTVVNVGKHPQPLCAPTSRILEILHYSFI